jgi:glucose-6-phosphate dehydrogenase assembly protein OpcA
VRDIAWARLQPWRELLAEVFDQPDAAAAHDELQHVTLFHGGAAPPAGAWLLAGWLGTCFGWTFRERSGARFRFDGPKRGVSLSFEREEGLDEPVVSAVRARSGEPHALDVRVGHRGHDATATIEFVAPRPRTLERTFRYREFAACLVGEIHRHEPNESLEHAARLASRLATVGSAA